MVTLGNFQVRSSKQLRSEIRYDTFTDINTLNNYYLSRPNSIKIFESFSWTNFKWSESYIRSRFQLAKDYKNKVNGLVFLLQEEVYKPSRTPQVSPSTANGNSYQLEGVTIPAMPGNEDVYFTALLTAWKNLCASLGKKAVILGSPAVCSDDDVWIYMYGSSAINYIANNYDMIYLYHFPITKSFAQGSLCTQQNGNPGKYDASSYIKFWRNKGFKGLINYLLVTKFAKGVGTTDYATVEADFINAANAGVDIISTYPYINEANNDNDATERMIQIYNNYNPTTCKSITCNFTITN